MIAGGVVALIVAAGLGALAGGRSDAGGATSELSSLREQNRQLQSQLGGAVKARQDAEDLAKGITTKITALEKDLRDIQTAKADAEERAKAASAKAVALDKDLRDAQAAKGRAEELSRAAVDKGGVLEAQMRDLARQLDAARSQLQTVESDLRKASARADAAEAAMREAQVAAKAASDKLAAIEKTKAVPVPKPSQQAGPVTNTRCRGPGAICFLDNPLPVGSSCVCDFGRTRYDGTIEPP
jgi:chromosome segregation ATPase